MIEQLRFPPQEELSTTDSSSTSLVASVHNAMKRLDKTVIVLIPYTSDFQPLINTLEDNYKVKVSELYPPNDYVAVIGEKSWIKVSRPIAQNDRYPLVRDEGTFFPAKAYERGKEIVARTLGEGSWVNGRCSVCDTYSINEQGFCTNLSCDSNQVGTASKYQELSFARLSEVNLSRCLKWHPNGIDSWSISDWLMAMAGEAGEACNAGKKLRRWQDRLVGNRTSWKTSASDAEEIEQYIIEIGKELADVVIYCDLVAQRIGLNLGSEIIDKFNEVSVRNDFPERL